MLLEFSLSQFMQLVSLSMSLLGISGDYIGMSWIFLGNILGIYCKYLGDILGISQVYLIDISGISLRYLLGLLWDILGTS